MPVTPRGYEYHFHNADGRTGHRERWQQGVNAVSEVYMVPWTQADAWQVEMAGEARVVGGRIHRDLPLVHPYYDWMVPTDFELIETIGQLGTTDAVATDTGIDFAAGAQSIWNVTYKSVRYQLLENAEAWAHTEYELCRYVERDKSFAVESLSLPTSHVIEYTDTSSEVIGARGTSILYPTKDLIYRWHRVPCEFANGRNQLPAQLETNIDNVLGRVNSAKFDGGTTYGRYAAGTLLCMAPKIIETAGPTGKLEYTIEYLFRHRPGGWNTKLRLTDSGGSPSYEFANVRFRTVNQTPYLTGDFYKLFRLTA